MSDRFGEIDHSVEHLLDERMKSSFETEKRDASGILVKLQKARDSRQRVKKRISKERDGNDFLKDKSREESLQRIGTFASEGRTKGMIKLRIES